MPAFAGRTLIVPNPCTPSLSDYPTIWIQLREAAGGRSERGAIQWNRVSWFPTNLSPTALVVSKPREPIVGTVRRGKSNGAATRWGYSIRHPSVFCSQQQAKA